MLPSLHEVPQASCCQAIRSFTGHIHTGEFFMEYCCPWLVPLVDVPLTELLAPEDFGFPKRRDGHQEFHCRAVDSTRSWERIRVP